MQNERSRPPVTGLTATPLWRSAAATLAMTLAGAVTMAASAPRSATGGLESASTPASDRLREGTHIADRLGTFTLTAKQPVFHTSDGKLQLGGLPNLNLERVVRTLQDRQAGLIWSVSGIVTEYHGGNYVLITRAMLKSTQSTRLSPLERRNSGGQRLQGPKPDGKPATQRAVPPNDRSATWGPPPLGHRHDLARVGKRPA
jgi:hypothetical protein